MTQFSQAARGGGYELCFTDKTGSNIHRVSGWAGSRTQTRLLERVQDHPQNKGTGWKDGNQAIASGRSLGAACLSTESGKWAVKFLVTTWPLSPV